MVTGIVELIALLLSLAGFGLQANPKAPTADAALEYAMSDADLVMHFDALAVVPGNYKALTSLPEQAQIKASPDLQKMVRQVINEIEGARGLAKSATGIDVTTDVYDGTVFVQFPQGGRGDPQVVASVHGKFSTATIDKIAGMVRKPVTKVGAGAMVEPDRDVAVGVTKSGVLIAGTPTLVKDRVNDTWKAPARAAGSNLAYAAEVLATKPIYTVVATLSPNARSLVERELGTKVNLVTDLVKRHKVFAFSAYQNGIGWTWIDTKAGGVDQMEMMSNGVVELLRAAQVAPRGISKILIGGLESYRGTDKRIDEILKNKAALFKIVESFTGDGQFKAQVTKTAKTNRLDVRLTGKTFSEVVPFSLALPAVGFLTLGRVSAPPPPPPTGRTQVPPARPTPPPPRAPGTGLTPAKK